MKNPLKLFIALSLLFSAGLAGCSKVTPAPTPTPEPEVVAVTGISSTEEGFSLIVGEEHTLVYTIAPENATNKAVTVASESQAISIEGSVVTGVAEGEATVTVTTVDGGFSISYAVIVKEAVEPVITEFPCEEIAAFFAEAGVAGVVVPEYALASAEAFFEIDDTDPESYVVYVTGSSHEEMVDFKDDMLYANWKVRNVEDGDYLMQFGETAAYASLVDFGDYIGIAFYAQGVEPAEGMTPEEAMTEFGTYFGLEPEEVESGVFGIYAAYVYDEDENNPAAIMEYVDMIFEYVLTEFTAAGDWTASEGDNIKYFLNEALTAIEAHVYEDTVYVKDGYIVPEGTEGAEAYHVTCVEAYSYTVAL